MKKKPIKHFVPDKIDGMGIPACKCFGKSIISGNYLPALPEEIAKTRHGVTCKRCRNIKIVRRIR